MRRTACVILVTLVMSSLAAASPPQHPSGPQLRLHRGTIDARATASQSVNTLAVAAPGPYSIVQFRGPVTPADRAALEQRGFAIIEYLPDYAYLVRGEPQQRAATAQLAQVYAVSSFTLADKFAPSLLRMLGRGETSLGMLRVTGWPDDQGQLTRDMRAANITATTAFDAATARRVAALPSVRWIEPRSQPRLLNDVARGIMHVDQAWQTSGLRGAGQSIAVADSGLDTGDMASMSPDFTQPAGRIVATHVLSAGGDLADELGHGTHVAGSVAGSGVQSGADPTTQQYAGSFAGVAPEAGLVIQAFESNTEGAVIGLDDDYYQLFAQSYANGARLATNSWGDLTGPITDTAAAYGGYPYGAQRVDQFMWEHPDMAIFFAAGNSGQDGTPGSLGFCTGGDGVVDPDSLLYPGTAKNVVTVGASESERASGGLASAPWLLISFCFFSSPIASDTLSNNPNGIAAFSSRGPADDGRIKPDIVAPGTNIVSNKSHHPDATALWGQHESNPDYVYSGGTSMATPLTAGAAALIRQWLVTRGLPNPSAAAVKATLLATAQDIAPGQYGTGAQQEIPFARPNNVSGWGRADLGFVGAAQPAGVWVDDHTSGLATEEQVEYAGTAALEITSSEQPLRVLLAWTDAPASLSAATQLVNDLDLEVVGPGGMLYHGNDAAAGDRVNNVEGIVIDNPPVGTYTVRVRGHNVPIATQPYALSVSGPIGAGPQSTPVALPAPASTPTPTTPTPSNTPDAERRLWLPLLAGTQDN